MTADCPTLHWFRQQVDCLIVQMFAAILHFWFPQFHLTGNCNPAKKYFFFFLLLKQRCTYQIILSQKKIFFLLQHFTVHWKKKKKKKKTIEKMKQQIFKSNQKILQLLRLVFWKWIKDNNKKVSELWNCNLTVISLLSY